MLGVKVQNIIGNQISVGPRSQNLVVVYNKLGGYHDSYSNLME